MSNVEQNNSLVSKSKQDISKELEETIDDLKCDTEKLKALNLEDEIDKEFTESMLEKAIKLFSLIAETGL